MTVVTVKELGGAVVPAIGMAVIDVKNGIVGIARGLEVTVNLAISMVVITAKDETVATAKELEEAVNPVISMAAITAINATDRIESKLI